MDEKNWIETYLNKITSLLKSDENVTSLCTFGSINDATTKLDKWSDLDILIVVKDSKVSDFYPGLEWLKPLGEYFAVEQSASNDSYTSKIIFDDFKKIDLLIISESNINTAMLLNKKLNIIFSKSELVTNLLDNPALYTTNNSNITELYDINALSNEFWYISYGVIIKIARNDLLIALHLTLEMYKKCLLISLWLRDRESNTNIHRIGGLRNDDITKLYFPPNPITKESVIDMLEKIGLEFESLATEWSADYLPKYKSFHKLLSDSKNSLLK